MLGLIKEEYNYTTKGATRTSERVLAGESLGLNFEYA